jgi:hypothetical protein
LVANLIVYVQSNGPERHRSHPERDAHDDAVMAANLISFIFVELFVQNYFGEPFG